MVVKLVIRKIPREGRLIDHPVNFPKLENLHLDLMEVKAKLKPGLPIVPQPDTPPKLKRKIVYTAKGDIIDLGSGQTITHTARKSEPPRIYHTGKVQESDGEDDELISRFGKKSRRDRDRDRRDDDAISIGGSDGGESIPESELDEYETEDEDAHLTPEEKEAKDRQEYMWRFKILKKQYKDAKIPEWNEFSDVGMMKVTYNQTVKELYLDESVQSYKMYLIGGFLATEYLGTQFLGIDLTGFTMMQLKSMAKYERMLIELGEKSYMQWGNNIPVEARLLGTILLQAGIFWMTKMLSQKAGNNIGGMLQMFMGGAQGGNANPFAAMANAGNAQASGPPPKRGGMRGPSRRVD